MYIHIHTYICMYTYECVCIYRCISLYVYTYIYTYIDIHIYIYRQVYIYIYIGRNMYEIAYTNCLATHQRVANACESERGKEIDTTATVGGDEVGWYMF